MTTYESLQEENARLRDRVADLDRALERAGREQAEREQALARAEEHSRRLDSIFMGMPAILCVFRGPEHVWELANRYSQSFLNNRIVLGRTVREVFPEFAEQGLVDLLDEVYTTGVPWSGQEIVAKSDWDGTGKVEDKYFNLTYLPTRNAEGEVDGILHLGLDVTPQVLARREIERLNTQLRVNISELERVKSLVSGILEGTQAVIYVKDLEGRYLLTSRTLDEFFGRGRGYAVGKTDYELFPPGVADELRRFDAAVVKSGTPMEAEEAIPQGDGIGHVLSYKFPLHNEQREIFALGGISTDVTQRRRDQEALQRMNEQLEQRAQELRTFYVLVENAPDGIGVTAPDGTQQYANAAYRTMTGYGDAIVGMKLAELMDNPPEEEELRAVLERSTFRDTTTCRRKDGSSFPAQRTVFAIPGAQAGSISLGIVVRDLTEQILAEQARAALQQQVIEAQRAILRELSAPLIPLSSDVVLLPLIGSIDAERVQEATETLLRGVEQHRARFTILDITGVRAVDAPVADALVRMAQAVRLLGARAVITGMQPRIAQMLVEIGVDLGGILTLGTLEAGIAYATRR